MLNSFTLLLIGIVIFSAPSKVLALDSCRTGFARNGVELVKKLWLYKIVLEINCYQ